MRRLTGASAIAVRALGALVATGLLLLAPGSEFLAAQAAPPQQRTTLGGGVQFQGYQFDDGLGAEAATLLLVPVAFSTPVSDNVDLELYGAWARGQIERNNQILTLDGFTDAQVRGSYTPTPWALLTLSLNLPSGNSTHTAQEALVASVLATDLLGFREANWGTGFGMTSGIATARQLGQWNLGLGASYRMSNGFEPEEGSPVTYEPGNEMRFRVGLDRNVGDGGKITGGVTFQDFDTDQYDGRNLFRAGSRIRVDASYAFRTGRSTWTLFGINSWRQEGDLTLTLLDGGGATVGDTLVHTGSQNVSQVGVAGSIPVGSLYRIRPTLDLQVQGTDGPGAGWIMGAGGDFPIRLFGFVDVFPRAKFLTGRIEGADGSTVNVVGGEVGGTIRWRR